MQAEKQPRPQQWVQRTNTACLLSYAATGQRACASSHKHGPSPWRWPINKSPQAYICLDYEAQHPTHLIP